MSSTGMVLSPSSDSNWTMFNNPTQPICTGLQESGSDAIRTCRFPCLDLPERISHLNCREGQGGCVEKADNCSWRGEGGGWMSVISAFNHVSVSTRMLHCWYSFWCWVSTSNSSILLGRDLMFPIMTGRRAGWETLWHDTLAISSSSCRRYQVLQPYHCITARQ